MKTLPVEEVAAELGWHFEQLGVDTSNGPALTTIVNLQAERVKTLREMAQISRYFFEEVTEFDAAAAKKHLRPVAGAPLALVRDKLAALADWSAASIQEAIQSTCTELDVGMGKVGMPLRVAATGGGNSPSLDATLEALPQDRVVARISLALDFIKAREEQG
jgi:glutamyl-tRNA synthetase